jgi:ParB-like chromosome segregation protein Spo0J
MDLDLSKITVNGRHRKDQGDLSALAASIEQVGLLHPLVVTPDYLLVAGGRRLEALRLLGRKSAPVRIVTGLDDTLQQLKAERDENTCRKDFTLSEAVAVKKALYAMERKSTAEKHAEARRRGGKKAGNGRPQESRSRKTFPRPTQKQDESARTDSRIGETVGFSRITLNRAEAVVDAAKEDPSLQPMVDEMDRRGKVNGVYERVKQIQAKQQRAKLPKKTNDAIRCGDFREVLADLPDESVDLIFTDPRYDKGSIPLYGDLASLAARVLTPGGSLVCYAGQYALPAIFPLMTPHIRFQWMFALRHSGGQRRMHGWRVRVGWKPLLWFVKGQYSGDYLLDLLDSQPGDKIAHDWAQGHAEAAYLIERLCPANGMVIDPMAGSGTTLAVAAHLGRRCIGSEIDAANVAIAAAALSATGGVR